MYASALAVHVTFMGVEITAKVVVVSREESHRHVLINLHIVDVDTTTQTDTQKHTKTELTLS